MLDKSKEKEASAEHGDDEHPVAPASTPASNSASSSAPSPSTKSGPLAPRKAGSAADISPVSPPLLISRNKHWRFISCYHGYWLSIGVESMKTMAHINYNAARPPPIHPGTFFDLVKIRDSVGEAVQLGVKAAGSTKSRKIQSVYHKRACNQLARAYRLDEIATSVAVMQETSALEHAGSDVLDNKKEVAEGQDLVDAKYVHFFEERIPSRQVAKFTTLSTLDSIIDSYFDRADLLGGIYRTRAFTKAFKQDHEGASNDLRQALGFCAKANASRHGSPSLELEVVDPASKRRREDVELAPEDQPSGLESQLLFHKASMQLSIACKYLQLSMPSRRPQNGRIRDIGSFTEDANEVDAPSLDGVGSTGADSECDEATKARIQVKKYARLARTDFMAFLSLLEYTPDMPSAAPRDFIQRVRSAHKHSLRHTRTPDSGIQYSNRIHKMSELFREVPPPGLPEWPPEPMVRGEDAPSYANRETFEAVTFHPLLGEALHCLLLCHCLMQTPAKELTRYAYMASRLYVLSNPWPLFQPSRSPARGDWIEILDKCADTVKLVLPWEMIAPYPPPQPYNNMSGKGVPLSATMPAASPMSYAVAQHSLKQRRLQAPLTLVPPPPRPPTPPNLIERTEIGDMKERVSPAVGAPGSHDGGGGIGSGNGGGSSQKDERAALVEVPKGHRDLISGLALRPVNQGATTPYQIKEGHTTPNFAALEEREQRRIAGRGEYIARWVNEVPFVKVPGKKKKKGP